MMKNIIISPNEFKESFEKVLHTPKIRKKLFEQKDSRSDYTDLWGSKDGKKGLVYREISKELKTEWQHEYWETDAAFFTNKCPHVGKTHYRGRAKVLSVALEHENDSTRAALTMNRLITTTATLKVMVIYPKQKNDTKQKLTKNQILNTAAKQLKAVDKVIKGFSDQQKHMIIFGYFEKDKTIKWQHHHYQNENFSKI